MATQPIHFYNQVILRSKKNLDLFSLRAAVWRVIWAYANAGYANETFGSMYDMIAHANTVNNHNKHRRFVNNSVELSTT